MRTVNATNKITTPYQSPLLSDTRPPKEAFRYVRNYLAGRFIGATRDESLLDEVLKCLFCKLYLEVSGVDSGGEYNKDHIQFSQFFQSIFHQACTDFPEIYAEDDELLLGPEILQHVIHSLNFPLLDANSDPIGDAFEVFAGSESRARSGQFFTPRNATDLLVRLIEPQPGEKIIDPACGAGGFLSSVIRHYRRQDMSASSIREAATNLYGVEKDDYLAKLGRLHVSILSGGHPNVVCGDSLALTTEAGSRLEDSIPVSDYDVVLTNPPFGVNIVAASAEVLGGFELARQWRVKSGRLQPTSQLRSRVPPQVLFVERCVALLREGGRFGMVVPESMISNKSYRYVVEFLRTRGSVNTVIGMPESLFKTSGKGGTHTKTCIIIFTKGDDGSNHSASKIFMAEARWCGKDSRAREIPRDDLPVIGDRFFAYQKGAAVERSQLGFELDLSAINDNVLCPRYYDPDIDTELNRLTKTHKLLRFGKLVEDGYLSVRMGHEVGKMAYGTGDIPFVRTSDLSNWEIKIQPKHRLDRKIYESLKDTQDVRVNDILMVKDGTYLIGTCGIVTDYDLEIVYQSHLYKIRSHKNPYGIDQFLLLAVLGSDIVQRQIRAKQFTQDIIDSLGERINELVLPIPKGKEKRSRISDIVRQVIRDRVDARELARQVAIEVLQ